MTQPVADAHDRTVRWRQLVDLISRPHDEIDPALLDAALTMVRTGMRSVARPIRAATARSIAGRAAEPRLIAIFASDRLEVAAPLLAAAPLDDAGWSHVMAAASKEVAAFMRTIRVEQAPPAEPVVEPAPPIEDELHPSIGEIAARIERLKSRRESEPPVAEAMPPGQFTVSPPVTTPGLFRWECDASGEIGWVEGAPRGALIGRSLPGEESAPRELVRAFADRLPFEDTPITLPAPVLDGEWRLSGIPAFSPVDGRFLGYRGIARRDGECDVAEPGAMQSIAGDAEALRETIHEIKTPLNAIIGFAEIIDGQYLGPAHRNYRQRAAEIVSQARMLLGAIEDLDFAARLQGRKAGEGEVAALSEIVSELAEEWAGQAIDRGVQLRMAPQMAQLRARLDRDLAGRLLKRFLGALIESAAPHETVHIEAKEGRGRLAVAASRPAATLHLGEAQLFDPSFATAAEGEGSRLGLGFALRLVRGLARLAGGELSLSASQLTLMLPLARE
ncbi:HAMP domain-containing sensor histidine kinase [Sphingomonas sp.]|uniref:sensor histidine kinase n=1 Tax=Sphingomonas sp. TaxID=28214 RepID=UPI0025F5C325|nr:HAMP domain-containing sensor histidine kinase [Sphingomonas sp.]